MSERRSTGPMKAATKAVIDDDRDNECSKSGMYGRRRTEWEHGISQRLYIGRVPM